MIFCAGCGKPIDRDEIGLTRKMINRGATEFFCFDCLGKKFRCTREVLEEMVRSFREAGCTLFQ